MNEQIGNTLDPFLAVRKSFRGDLGNLLLTLELKQDLIWSGESGDIVDSDESSDSGESGN